MERHTDKDTGMVTQLSDCKPAIRVVEKLDSGIEAPRSSIEARIQHALETRENKLQETDIAWTSTSVVKISCTYNRSSGLTQNSPHEYSLSLLWLAVLQELGLGCLHKGQYIHQQASHPT